jgi:5-methylcytosine-specific restriction protein A
MPKFMMYDFSKKANFVEWNSMFIYFTFMQRIEGDYGFYPLVRNEFNESKSNIFAIECLANGMSVIADYYFKEFRLPGVILYDGNHQFNDIINDIIKGNIDKVSLVKEGRKHLNEVLHIDLLNQQRYKILKGL